MAQKIYSTPNSDDFYVIPEFLEHQQCWMVWPERTDNWSGMATLFRTIFW
ncbi:hypothetical protein [Spiroplasma endosymbiont of Dactylopius coccus]